MTNPLRRLNLFWRLTLSVSLLLFIAQLLALLLLRDVLLNQGAAEMAALVADRVRLAERHPELEGAVPVRRESAPVGPASTLPYLLSLQRAMQPLLPERQIHVVQGKDNNLVWVSSGAQWLGMELAPFQRTVWRYALAVLAVIVLLASIGGAVLAAGVARPIARLAGAAGAVARGEPEALPAPAGASELRRLHAALVAAAEQSARLAADRELMLAGVSHDLRTPITRARLELEMLSGDPQARADVVRDLDEMDRIIGRFIDYVRLGRQEAPRTVDLDALIAETVSDQRRLGRSMALRCQSLGRAAVRPVTLRRVLDNLLDNAFCHGRPPVRLDVSRSAGKLHLQVLDRGAGIAPERLEQLRKPFVTASGSRGGGSGLGLAVVERGVAAMGGTVDWRTTAEGWCVALKVPLR